MFCHICCTLVNKFKKYEAKLLKRALVDFCNAIEATVAR